MSHSVSSASASSTSSSSGGGGSKRQAQAVRIGNYRLGKTLGKGSFGKVKLAEHTLTGHKVAVKILNRQKIKNSKMDQKIKREIRILKLLRHPHIIRLYEVIETQTDIFMIMEHVSGGELFDYIVKRGRLTEDDARHFFQQIVCGVEYCHAFKVVHRDLKPENLLLDADNNVKIADFGLSNIMEDGSFLHTSCGSPNYAAPEVISGNLYAGPEVDVWSCGVILYALLCGRLPFDEESIPALFKKIKEGNYVLPPHLSSATKELISSILVVDPMKRIPLKEIRANPWFQQNLPRYLQVPPHHFDAHNSVIDPSILADVCQRCRVSEEEAREALVAEEMNDITVVYHLLLDHQKRHLTMPGEEMEEIGDVHYAASPPHPVSLEFTAVRPAPARERRVGFEVHTGTPPVSPAAMLGTSFDAVAASSPPPPELMYGMREAEAEEQAQGDGMHSRRRGRWMLGATTMHSCETTLHDVYAALRDAGCVWKVKGEFDLKCKWRPTENGGRPVTFGLQILRNRPAPASGHHSSRASVPTGYTVDVRHLDGPYFTYLDLTCDILRRISP